MRINALVILLLLSAIIAAGSVAAFPSNEVNFTYLETLRRKVTLKEKGLELRPWMEQEKKNGELSPTYVAKTETISKIALMYLSWFEKTGDRESLTRGRDAVDILLLLQGESGLFASSIGDDGSFSAGTSPDYASASAFRAISRCFRVIRKLDAPYAARLESSMEKTIAKLRPSQGSLSSEKPPLIHGVPVSPWLISGRSDLTALFVLGLLEYYSSSPRGDVKEIAGHCCDAIAAFNGDSNEEFPFCAYYEDANNFSTWSLAHSRQIAAMALAGSQFGNPAWIESAERAANSIYPHFLASYGPLCGMAPGPVIYPQLPEGCEVMTDNLITLLNVTGKRNYALMAGLSASWLFGNNQKGVAMYDKALGKGYDYLDSQGRGSEAGPGSTADALLTLIRIKDSLAWEYLESREKTTPHTFIVLEAEEGKPVRKDYEIQGCVYPGGYPGKCVVIKKENSFWIKFEIMKESEYEFLLSFLRQTGLEMGSSIMMRIDGDRIFTVPLGGSTDSEYMAMEEVIEPRVLLPGYHSMGIRFSGLLHSKPSIIDSVVLQPVLEWRAFSQPSGETLVLVKSFAKDRKKIALDSLSLKNFSVTDITHYSRLGNLVSQEKNPQRNPASIEVPEYGYSVIRGK